MGRTWNLARHWRYIWRFPAASYRESSTVGNSVNFLIRLHSPQSRSYSGPGNVLAVAVQHVIPSQNLIFKMQPCLLLLMLCTTPGASSQDNPSMKCIYRIVLFQSIYFLTSVPLSWCLIRPKVLTALDSPRSTSESFPVSWGQFLLPWANLRRFYRAVQQWFSRQEQDRFL